MGFSLAELLSAFRDLICPVPYQQGLQTLETMWGWLFSEQQQKLVHFKRVIATMPPAPPKSTHHTAHASEKTIGP